jgi:hypothetical protein
MQGRIGLIENLKKQATGDPNELSKISTTELKAIDRQSAAMVATSGATRACRHFGINHAIRSSI